MGGYLSGPSAHSEQCGPSCGVCGGLSERDREFFRERHSASEGAGNEPQLQQCCKSAGTEPGGGTAHPCLTHSRIKQTATTERTAKPMSPSKSEPIDKSFNCFQATGRGWWNQSNIAETIRTPLGGDSLKSNIVSTIESAGFKPRNSSAARSIGYELEMSPTINTDENYATHIRRNG